MADLFDQLRGLVEAVIGALGYPGIVLVMALENILPPIPSEVVMPLAGFLSACTAGPAGDCSDFHLTLIGVVLAGTLGSVIGAVVLYYVGYFADETLIRRFVRGYGRWFFLDEVGLDKSLAYFDRHGRGMTFFGRLIPLVRSLISIPAGMQRMPMPEFLLFSTLGSGLWAGILAIAGYMLGANWPLVLGVLERYQSMALTLVGLAVLALVYGKWRDRHAELDEKSRP
ncbi:MAG: DedA family protein [Gemmatimonadaceae bacterium]|nr:DedA family protein [Gloeobacterales cyanobacterium ES-bin-141]